MPTSTRFFEGNSPDPIFVATAFADHWTVYNPDPLPHQVCE